MDNFLLPEEPVRFTAREMDRLLVYCTQHGASDITMQTNAVIMAEIYGRLYPITTRKISHAEVGMMINDIYGANGTTQIASGRDIDTHYDIKPDRTHRYRFRINATGCYVEGAEGIQITCRTIPGAPPDLVDMDLPQTLLDNIRPLQGVVIVTGATGSGKTTLLASIIKDIAMQKNANRKILSYEAPIEFVYDDLEMPTAIISQSEIPRHLPSFAAGLRNALRRKPGLILVGEARDMETINAVIDAALTGHPVYTTLHSNGVADCVRRMISVFPAEERNGRALDILETLKLVIWQKLVPTVDGKRIALREYLVFDDEIRDILVTLPVEKIAATTRRLLKEKGQPMLVDAQNKFNAKQIDERTFALFKASSIMADKDAGVFDG